MARNTAKVLCLEAPRITTDANATIFVEYWPKTYRGDVQNVHGSLKAYIDGVADAMGCDDKNFRVDFPSVFAGKSKNGKVIMRIVSDAPAVPFRGTIGGDK